MSLTEQREGVEAGRLDMFVDGAFALTLTLLLIGGEEIPRSSDELLAMLGGIPAFAACFAQIAMFWYGHVRWRHHCPSSDATGRVLSLLLVFLALIFVYPLHMVFSSLFNGISPWFRSAFHPATADDLRTLFVCYGLSFACMGGTLVLLHRHAARLARRAGRDPMDARRGVVLWSVPTGVGLLSAVVALALLPWASPGWWGVPGFMYFLMTLTGPIMRRFRRRHEMA